MVCSSEATRKFKRPTTDSQGVEFAVCVPAHCENDELDGNETTRDCGGDCGCPRIDILTEGMAYAASADGTVIAGYTSGNSGTRSVAVVWQGISEPFVAYDRKTILPLGHFVANPPSKQGAARAISAGGNVVVGSVGEADDAYVPFRWTEASGVQRLGTIAGGEDDGWADDVSADGSVIVGAVGSRMRHSVGTAALLSGSESWRRTGESFAVGVSDDGSRIVGMSGLENPHEHALFIWEEEAGMRALQDVLVEHGYEEEFPDIPTIVPEAISADGNTIVALAEVMEAGAHQYRPLRIWLVW